MNFIKSVFKNQAKRNYEIIYQRERPMDIIKDLRGILSKENSSGRRNAWTREAAHDILDRKEKITSF